MKGTKDLREVAELRYNHYQNKRKKYFEQIMRAYGPIEKPKKKKSPYMGGSSLNVSNMMSISSPTSMTLPQISNNFQFSPPSKLQQFGGNLQSNTNYNSPTSLGIMNSGSGGINNSNQSSLILNHRASIRMNNTMILNSPHINQHQQQNIDSKKPITVGKISFKPAKQPMSSQRRSDLNQSLGGFITQPNIDTSSNYQVQFAQKIYEKEKERVEKFRKVRENAVHIAKQTVQRYQEKLNHKLLNFDRFKSNLHRKNQEDQKRIEQNQQRRNNARENFSRTIREIESKSQSIYDHRLQELSQLTNKRSQREKQMSSSQFLTLKKKIEDEQLHSKILPQARKKENREIGMYLQRLEYKIQRGQEKASKMLHESTLMRTNKFESILQETQNKYKDILDLHHNRSLDRVRTKDSLIENKLKKKIAEEDKKRNSIRQLISQKFDRSRSIREDLRYQDEQKVKATIDRLENKMKVHENISYQNQIHTLKRKEMNSLRKLDVEENYRSVKQSILLEKAKVMNKMHKIDEIKRQAEDHNKKVIEKLKFSNLIAERSLMHELNPREILVRAKLNLTLQATGQSPKVGFRGRNSNRNSVSHNEN